MDNDQIVSYLTSMDKEGAALKSELLKMCWYMRGGLTYDEAIMLDPAEKKVLADLIKENLETTQKSGLPFF